MKILSTRSVCLYTIHCFNGLSDVSISSSPTPSCCTISPLDSALASSTPSRIHGKPGPEISMPYCCSQSVDSRYFWETSSDSFTWARKLSFSVEGGRKVLLKVIYMIWRPALDFTFLSLVMASVSNGNRS